jgi:hypothetical protein
MSSRESASPLNEAFLNQALPRVRKFMLILLISGVLICAVFFRWAVVAGFVSGGVVSYVNQRWLEGAIEALGDRITQQQSRERGGIIVVRAMLRYVLIAAGAYVIFSVSLGGLYGFLGGVFVPIAAIACEVIVEIFIALRHGT